MGGGGSTVISQGSQDINPLERGWAENLLVWLEALEFSSHPPLVNWKKRMRTRARRRRGPGAITSHHGRKNKGLESERNRPLEPGGEEVENQPVCDRPGSNLLEDFLLFRTGWENLSLYRILDHLCWPTSHSWTRCSHVVHTMTEEPPPPAQYRNSQGQPAVCLNLRCQTLYRHPGLFANKLSAGPITSWEGSGDQLRGSQPLSGCQLWRWLAQRCDLAHLNFSAFVSSGKWG